MATTDSITLPVSEQPDKPTQRPAIGEKCIIRAQAYKSNFVENPDNGNKYPRLTTWRSTGEFGIPITGHYIGYRVVHEGKTYLEYDEDGHGQVFRYPVWKHEKSHVVWLFVESEKHSPLYVFPKDVERITTQAADAQARQQKGGGDE